MGFDLHGCEPKSKKGEYFRNNVWWWRPLWGYVSEIACKEILTEKQKSSGHFNDGCLISEVQALAIAKRLRHLLECGAVRRQELDYRKSVNEMPDVECSICKGQGERNDAFVKGICNACKGKGTVRPFETSYPFEESNVREFAEFCQTSGGFEIW